MPPSELPNVAALLAPTLEATAPEARPLLIALAERMAAGRYRTWAEASTEHAVVLRECAAREEQIASIAEGLHADAAGIQAGLRTAHPELDTLNRTLFEGRPVHDQYTLQAQGERLGAATWRALADASEADAREAYLACAELEERSAEVLEAILGTAR